MVGNTIQERDVIVVEVGVSEVVAVAVEGENELSLSGRVELN